jgi:hypothetical protein
MFENERFPALSITSNMNHTTNATYPAHFPSLAFQLAHQAMTVGLFYAIVFTTILCFAARNCSSNWEFWSDIYHCHIPQADEDIVSYFCHLLTHIVLIPGTGDAVNPLPARVIAH